MRFLNTLVSTFILTLVVGCGGGGGGAVTSGGTNSVGTTEQSTPQSTDVAPAGQTLTITSLNLTSSDVIANTAPQTKTLVASILDGFVRKKFNFLEAIIPNAYAVVYQSTYPPVTYDPNFTASRKFINGNLVRLDPVVKYFEEDSAGKIIEKQIKCDFTNVEVYISKVYELNANASDFLVLASVPNTVDKDCKLGFKSEVLYVQNGGNTFIVTSAFTSPIVDVIQANDPGFNNSNFPLVVDSSGLVKIIEIQMDGSLKLTDLNTTSAPINTNYSGAFSFNGDVLFGASSISNNFQSATYFAFKKNSTQFKIVRPTGWSTNYYLSSILDHNGRILFHYASDPFKVLNTDDWSYADLFPVQMSSPNASIFPGNMYGAQGRYGKWILSDRGVLWNYETKQSLCLMTYPVTDTSNYDNCAWGGKYVRLWGKYAYVVDKNSDNFVRYDVETGAGVAVSLAAKGYIATDFNVFKNLAMVQVINSQNSDKKFIEINFDSGNVIDRGVISLGDRRVDTFTAIGKGG